MTEHNNIPIELIHPSPTNPRKTFDRTQLNELADSIKAHTVLQPVTVRKHPTQNHGSFELVHGERRWRAAKLAGLSEIPALVVELTDTQVLERQLIENAQRVDVHPLDEAEAYQALLDHHGYTMDVLVEKTGKSLAHLYGRLKLSKLAPGPRKAFRDGRLSASIAEAIARLPVPKLQEEACKDVLGEDASGAEHRAAGIEYETIQDNPGDGAGYYKAQPLSFRAAIALIHRKYSLRLELAKFPVADSQLIPDVGACGPCQHKSDNQPELPGMGAAVKGLCTNPPCFEKKTQAAWKQAAAAAEERGLEVVEGKDAERVFTHDGVTVRSESPYIDLDTPLPYDLAKQPGVKVTFGKLLGKKAAEIPRVLVQDESGAPRELLDRKAVIDTLRELGKIDKPTKPKSNSTAQKERFEKQQAKQELNRAALVRLLGQVAEGAAEDLGKKETAFWRWMARCVFASVHYGDADDVAERRELKRFDDLEDVIEKARSVADLRGLIAELFICLDGHTAHTSYGSDKGAKERFEEGVKLCGGDWDAAVDAAKASAKAEAKSDAAKDKKAKGGSK